MGSARWAVRAVFADHFSFLRRCCHFLRRPAWTSIRVDIGSKPTTRVMPVDSTMGSKHAKGSREVAAPKRPGPTPALPPKRQRKADAHAARVEKMNNHNERKKLKIV